VTTVRGTHDIQNARLVIHGRFSNPQHAIQGPLSVAKVSDGIQEVLKKVDQLVGALNLRGLISFSFEVLASGKVGRIKTLVSTLQAVDGSVEGFKRQIESLIKVQKFASARGVTHVTLPLVFT